MFYLYKEQLTLDENKIEVPSLKTLIGKLSKKDGLNLALYIFLIHDRSEDNPIKDMSESERLQEAGDLVYNDSNIIIDTVYPKHSKDIQTAIRDYTRIMTDKMQKELDLYDIKIYQFIDLLEDPDNAPQINKNEHELSGAISYSTNMDILTSILDNVIDIIVDKATVLGMKKSGKFLKSLRGGLSPNTKGKTLQIKS